MDTQFNIDISKGERFSFGENWSNFLHTIDEKKIKIAEESLLSMLEVSDFKNLKVIDIGSGSGLLSLAFKRLGASLVSFDYDPNSVECTRKLKESFFPNDPNWEIKEGSILNDDFINELGQFDIVYSWGVLHHTGNMWKSIENACKCVKKDGKLFIGIYKDEGLKSRIWKRIKKFYCSSRIGKFMILSIFIPYYIIRGGIEDLFQLKNPWKRYKEYYTNRGMSKFYDWIDWLGGYPYEFSSEEELTPFVEKNDFSLIKKNSVTMVELIFKKKEIF